MLGDESLMGPRSEVTVGLGGVCRWSWRGVGSWRGPRVGGAGRWALEAERWRLESGEALDAG